MIYFDYNATAPLRQVARDAWLKAQTESWFNPSSPYRKAGRVRNQLQEARAQLAGYLNRPAEHVSFCSGATEANNTVFASAARILSGSAKVAVSALEHPSVIEPAQRYFPERCLFLPMRENGVLDLESLPMWLDSNQPALVSLQAANNEVGLIQPMEECTEICRDKGIWVHCDAVQWAGRYPLGDLPVVDALTISGHKFGSPKGVGALVVDTGFSAGLIWGGGQESGRRSGTENYPAISAMMAALHELHAFVPEARQIAGPERVIRAAESLWGDAFFCPGRSSQTRILWNTLSLTPPRHAAHRWIHQFERRGILIASGAACSTAARKTSSTMRLLGLSDSEAARTIRISAGWETTDEDWEALAKSLVECWRALEADSDSSAMVIEID